MAASEQVAPLDALEQRSWHTMPVAEVVRAQASRLDGLSDAEALGRLARFGPNRLPEPKRRTALGRYLAQFNNLLGYVLLAAAAISAAISHLVDATVILAVVLVQTTLGYFQEGKAERALEAIRGMLAPRATVLRDGVRRAIPAEDLVPGDVVVLEPGDKVSADLRLVRTRGLRVQEAALTGESTPVDKQTEPVSDRTPLAERSSVVYAGTLIAAGQGSGIAIATSERTELGRISGLMAGLEPLSTPLLRQMNRLARWLTIVILGLAVLVFAFGVLFRDLGTIQMFMTVVALAVAAIPEGLPVILTITLAIGVQRMAARNAIVRRLPAVETLGSVSIICTDKTGTLTRNEMTVRAVAAAADVIEVGGVGYAPHGGFSRAGREIIPEQLPLLVEIARAATLCNDATLREAQGDWKVDGDPMEGALLTLGLKAGLDPDGQRKTSPRTDVIPFDTQHRFMASLHHGHGGEAFIYVKGAPEQVLAMCRWQQGPEDKELLQPAYWQARIEELATQGHRVLAIAQKPVRHTHRELRFSDVDKGLVMLGLVGLIDPPREEAIASVIECQSAGIRVKMITGDHAITAHAIACQLKLTNPHQVLTGQDLDALMDQELAERVPDIDVFARTAPEHKLRLVKALQAHDHVVAMTGDGVNDAPALRRADVGVAMGRSGTEVAKEAAKIVLADDNFASINSAVKEGRTVYDNLKKAITFFLPINGGESSAIIVAILAGYTLPITPLQILWVNMASSLGLAMALAFEPSENDIMQRPPRRVQEPLLSGFLLWRVALVSLLFLAGIFAIFVWAQANGSTVAEARTYAVNTLVVMEIFYLFSVRYLRSPSFTFRGIVGTKAVLISLFTVITMQLVFTYAPFMEVLFDTRPVDFLHGAEIIGIGTALFCLLELEKLLLRAAAPDGTPNAQSS